VSPSGAHGRALVRHRVVPGTDQRTSVPGATEIAVGTLRAFASAARLGEDTKHTSTAAAASATARKQG
jgi:hypothetical protein